MIGGLGKRKKYEAAGKRFLQAGACIRTKKGEVSERVSEKEEKEKDTTGWERERREGVQVPERERKRKTGVGGFCSTDVETSSASVEGKRK